MTAFNSGTTHNCLSSSSRAEYAQPQIGVDTKSREHLEIKACLLSYMHRINVDELQHTNHQSRLEIDRSRVQRLISHGGVLDDGTILDEARRKTVFLLRHFFSMDTYVAISTLTPPGTNDCAIVDQRMPKTSCCMMW
jgi:hypothetical protein